jgi:tRNA(fMet)-specific endonuclease VapC
LIVDTNALSAMADSRPGITAALASAQIIAIPVIVLGEYRFGISQSRRVDDYDKWLQTNLPLCRVLDITDATAHEYAVVRLELKRAGTPIPSNDIWIAALSRQHGLRVLSRDIHFDRVSGLRRVSW